MEMESRSHAFSRATLVAGAELLERLDQAQFDQMVIRLDLEEFISSGTLLSVRKKAVILSKCCRNSPDRAVDTVYGEVSLDRAMVGEAVAVMHPKRADVHQEAFRLGLARDGFETSFRKDVFAIDGYRGEIHRSLPITADVHEADDEVHRLLNTFGFEMARSHLDQGLSAYTAGNWAAANGQFRTFVEKLVDDLSETAYSESGPNLNNNLQRLSRGFLSQERAEWTSDGKGFVAGLCKMLHSDGAHPGLSDEEHSTFRLQLVLVTARTLLRRLEKGSWS